MPLPTTPFTTKRDGMQSPSVQEGAPKPPVRLRPSTAPSW
jgi:hypothetical protein